MWRLNNMLLNNHEEIKAPWRNQRENLKIYGVGAPGWISHLCFQLLISVQALMSLFLSSSPALGSTLAVGSLLRFSHSLSPCPSPACSASLSKSINVKKIKIHGDKWNENTTVQNLYNTTKEILRGKFIAIQVNLQE